MDFVVYLFEPRPYEVYDYTQMEVYTNADQCFLGRPIG